MEEGSHTSLLVCHHWFEVASRTPELWVFWGNSLEDWEKRHLRSSSGAPLDLVLIALPRTFGPFWRIPTGGAQGSCRARYHSTGYLQCNISDLLSPIISPLLSQGGGLQTNRLESLILCNEDHTPLDVSFLAHSHLSKLRRLDLAGCTTRSWEHFASQIALLTTLVLFFDESTPTPTMPQLLSILASNPGLQILTLNSRAIPDGNGDGGDSVHSVLQLHRLEGLRLDGDLRQVYGLLRRLELPKKMDELTLDVSHCVAADISQTIGSHLRGYLRCRGKPPNGLGIALSVGLNHITFKIGDVDRLRPSTSLSGMNSFASITLGIGGALPDDDLDRLTLDLISYTPREEIVYFRTHGSIEAAKDLRVQMPNLKALNLYSVPLSAVFPMLGQDGSHVHDVFPPSLQYLTLERPRLGIYNWIPLITFLSNRSSSGNQLDSLLINGPCHMCSRVTRRIQGMVGKLKVDDGCLESWCPFSTDCRWLS